MPNRAQRRQKVKDRRFTKKGYTRVIKLDDDQKTAFNIPTKKGGRLDGLAHHNTNKLRRGSVRGD